jgi:hypothetical protein
LGNGGLGGCMIYKSSPMFRVYTYNYLAPRF